MLRTTEGYNRGCDWLETLGSPYEFCNRMPAPIVCIDGVSYRVCEYHQALIAQQLLVRNAP